MCIHMQPTKNALAKYANKDKTKKKIGKMKKLLLTLGSSTAIIAPVVTVVACGDKEKTAVKFEATSQYETTADFARAVTARLANANIEKGITFSIGENSFNTNDGKYLTAITSADLKNEAAFTAWISKLESSNATIKSGLSDYNSKSSEADKATWIKGEITLHPHFAEIFGFKTTDSDAALVQKATDTIAQYNKIADTLKALDKEIQ